jgi:hypothetical protein
MTLLFLRALLSISERMSRRDERGQTTAEYALVIIGVAAVAGMLIAWADKSKAISRLFDVVIDKIIP